MSTRPFLSLESTDMNIENLKYSELQKLAKKCGVKANVKVDKLVKALKEHYIKQEQSDSDSHKDDKYSSTQPGTAKQDPCPEDEGECNTEKEKAPVRGRKKGKKRGPRGKAKKTSLSDDTQDDDDAVVTFKKVTPQDESAPSEQLSSPDIKPQSTTSAGKNKASSKTTPQAAAHKVSKSPNVVRPYSTKSLGSRSPGAKTTSTSARTPSKDQKTIHTKIMAEHRSPSLFSPRRSNTRPSGAIVESMAPKSISDSGKKLASSATKEDETSRVSGSKKRCSPRNQAGNPKDKDQILQAKDKRSPAQAGTKRKRKDTFELEGPSLAVTLTPEVEKTNKRARLSSGAGNQPDRPATPKSPGVQDMIDSMAGDISSAERRTRLMDALSKKVEGKVRSSPQTGPMTQIPRFAAFLAKKREEQKKPITPGNKDWEKVHMKEFSKFDSIDIYLEKKRKRAEEMTASVKKARLVLQEVHQAVTKLKSKRTPSLGRKSASQPFKPTVMSTKDMNLNFGASISSSKTPVDRKSTSVSSKPFNPIVTSTKDMNLNFGASISSSKTPVNRRSTSVSSKPFKPTVTSTKDMNLSFGALKTPVNQKPMEEKTTPTTQSTKKNMAQSARKSVGASVMQKSLSNTPFQFTGNLTMSSVNSSTTKPVFNLKASLARPITWKPHTGKLKPLDEKYSSRGRGLDNSATKPFTTSHMDIFKSMVNRTQKTYSRQDRRVAAAVKRAEQKHDLHMKRRGITVSP